MLATHGRFAASRFGSLVTPTALFRDASADSAPLLIASARRWASRSRRMPCKLLDAPDDLRKQALSQPTFGQLQDEVSDVVRDEDIRRPAQHRPLSTE